MLVRRCRTEMIGYSCVLLCIIIIMMIHTYVFHYGAKYFYQCMEEVIIIVS